MFEKMNEILNSISNEMLVAEIHRAISEGVNVQIIAALIAEATCRGIKL